MFGNKKSNVISRGRTLQTRDEFLKSGANKQDIKKDHPNSNDLYRRVGVMYCNEDGEMVVIKETTKGSFKFGKSKAKPFLEIEDNTGKPIKVDGKKFVLNSKKRQITLEDMDNAEYECISNPKTSKRLRKENKKKIDRILNNKKRTR